MGLLDQLRDEIRVRHYSRRTEETYIQKAVLSCSHYEEMEAGSSH